MSRRRRTTTRERFEATPPGSPRAIALAVALALVLGFAAPARADDTQGANQPDFMHVVVDLAVLRPLGLVSFALGSTFFMVALPFAAGTGQVATLGETLVAAPARYTFTREFGGY